MLVRVWSNEAALLAREVKKMILRHPVALAAIFGLSVVLARPSARTAEAQVYQVYSPSAACMTCAGGPAYRIVYQTVFDQQQVTAFRIEYDTVCEEHLVTRYRPVWETAVRENHYTVVKPVFETAVREDHYTVMRPVVETQLRDASYTRVRYVQERRCGKSLIRCCVR